MYLRALVVVLVGVLWSGSASAATPQQQCDYQRIKAWKKFSGCMDTVLAKNAKGLDFDEFAARAKCRHTYFRTWTRFQGKAALAGSTCIGRRFIDNGDQTVTDNLTTLVWEKKVARDNLASADPHDADNAETWGPSTRTGQPLLFSCRR